MVCNRRGPPWQRSAREGLLKIPGVPSALSLQLTFWDAAAAYTDTIQAAMISSLLAMLNSLSPLYMADAFLVTFVGPEAGEKAFPSSITP
jgi:hypothetical protein